MTTMDKIRVLLVEDEPTLAMIIKDTLDGEEFEVILAANGEEGLSRYKETKPDIIVTDIMMPKIDGFTMVRHIRKTDRQIPVLFLSARSAANDVVEGFELGGNDYLKKPFGMAELKAATSRSDNIHSIPSHKRSSTAEKSNC